MPHLGTGDAQSVVAGVPVHGGGESHGHVPPPSRVSAAVCVGHFCDVRGSQGVPCCDEEGEEGERGCMARGGVEEAESRGEEGGVGGHEGAGGGAGTLSHRRAQAEELRGRGGPV